MDTLLAIVPGDVMETVEVVRVGPAAEQFRPDAALLKKLQASTPGIEPRDPNLPPLFADGADLSLRDGYAAWINEKLHHYDAITDRTIRVRLLPGFARGRNGAGNSNPLRELHDELAGNDPRAATIVFLADENRWRLWIGDQLLEQAGLMPQAAEPDAQAKALNEFKRAILAETKQLWEAREPPHRAVDAAVTNLIENLDQPEDLTKR
jgi:hypothetical protein